MAAPAAKPTRVGASLPASRAPAWALVAAGAGRITTPFLPTRLPHTGAPAGKTKEVRAKPSVTVLAPSSLPALVVAVRPSLLPLDKPPQPVPTLGSSVEPAVITAVLATAPSVAVLVSVLVAPRALRAWAVLAPGLASQAA